MKSQILKILNLNRFFKVLKTTEDTVRFRLEKPSKILVQNIHSSWLRFVNSKTHKHFPVFLNQTEINKENIPFGLISNKLPDYENLSVMEHNFEECAPNNFKLHFKLIVPEQDEMQYFIQWQRYRKYWWSSVSISFFYFVIPSLIL